MRLKEEEVLLTEVPDYEDDEEIDLDAEDDNEPEDIPEPKKTAADDHLVPKYPSNDEVERIRAEVKKAQEEADEARREVAKEKFEREKSQYFAVKSHVEKLQIEDKAILREARALERDIDEAKAAGDTAKHRILQQQLDEITDRRGQIDSEVKQYNPFLANPPQEKAYEAPKRETKQETKVEDSNPALDYWKKANADWLQNPAHHKKMEKAKELITQYHKDYDVTSPVFWKFIDTELAKFEQPKRRQQPIIRGGTMDTDGPKKKKESNSEALKMTNQLLAARGFTSRDIDDPKFKKLSASYYKTALRNIKNKKEVA